MKRVRPQFFRLAVGSGKKPEVCLVGGRPRHGPLNPSSGKLLSPAVAGRTSKKKQERLRKGIADLGPMNLTVAMFEDRIDSKLAET